VAQLQKPEFVYMGGKLRSWDEATLHIGCEAVTRGLNVFEGIKGYWQTNGQFGILQLKRHYERLCRSAALLHIPCKWTYEEYQSAIFELIGALVTPDRDMWARTTLYVIEGHWGEGTMADLVVTAYHQDKHLPEPINLGVSTWRRCGDEALPARIKTSTNYQAGRLARIEGRSMDCQDMILLNQGGRVAEATGSCVLMVRDGTIYSPPATEGALESITLDVIEALAQSSEIKFVRRPIDRTELLIADELGLCGTLAELTLVKSVHGRTFPKEASILQSLQAAYMEVARGAVAHPAVELTYLPGDRLSKSESSTRARGHSRSR
jgi:branched-chain amino acid aminotransferase